MVLKGSIRIRTFCYFATGMLVIILAFSGLFLRYFSDVFKERMESDQIYTTASTAESVSTLFMNIRQNAYFLTSNDTLANVLVNRAENMAATQRELVSTTFSVNTGTPTAPLMQSAYAVLLLDPQFPLTRSLKSTFSLSEITRQRIYSAIAVQPASWYQETVARKGQIYAFRDGENEQNIFFSHQLRSTRIADPRYGENIGVVLYAVPQSKLLSLLRNAQITEGTIALLMFDDTVFLSTDTALIPIRQDSAVRDSMEHALALLDIPGGKITHVTLEGAQYAASSTLFQGNWRSILLVPDADLQQYLRAPLPVLITAVVLFLLISVLISFLFSRQLMRPIINLSGVMAQVQDAQYLPPSVPAPASHDEIAILYKSYNAMIERIRKLSELATEEAEKLRIAELKAMQAQINPHFIYNTLDSISCCALIEGNDDIVTMVSSLISILKYSVNFSRTTVPLREEIDHLQHYIRIQELRYTNGFRFLCNVPEKYFSVRIPQIILQPLVENALFHAQCHEAMLEIRLFCEQKGRQLLIHVVDNGSAGDAAKLNHMLQSDDDDKQSDSIGIRNVNKRIRLLHGGESGLHYEQLANGSLDAVVQIPLDTFV